MHSAADDETLSKHTKKSIDAAAGAGAQAGKDQLLKVVKIRKSIDGQKSQNTIAKKHTRK